MYNLGVTDSYFSALAKHNGLALVPWRQLEDNECQGLRNPLVPREEYGGVL